MSDGCRLKDARLAAGMTQLALANAAGTTRTTLSGFEGGAVPSRRLADRLAKALRVEAGDIWPKYKQPAQVPA